MRRQRLPQVLTVPVPTSFNYRLHVQGSSDPAAKVAPQGKDIEERAKCSTAVDERENYGKMGEKQHCEH